MFNLDQKKQKALFITIIVLLAAILFSIVIINYNSFLTFFAVIGRLVSTLNSIFIGIIIAYLLNPIEKFFVRKVFKNVKSNKAHKFLSILCTYLLVIAFITVFFLISIPQIVKSLSEMPAMLSEFAETALDFLEKQLIVMENSEFMGSILSAFNVESLDVEEIITKFATRFIDMETIVQTVATTAIDFLKNAYVVLKDLLIGFILSIYLLAAKDRILANGKKLVTAVCGDKKGHKIMSVLKLTNKTFGAYIQGTLIDSTLIGILVCIVFAIFGIPYPILLGIIIACTNIIPVFGPFIGVIPSALIVLIAAPEKLILMLILVLVIQQIDGNYIVPRILGESTGLPALWVFLAIIIMGGYFGIVGMIIGVPTFAVIATLAGRAIDSRLAKKGLSTDIADYYNKYSLEDDHAEEHKTLFTKIVDAIVGSFKSLVSNTKKIFKKLPKIRKKSSLAAVLAKKDIEEIEAKEEEAETNSQQ